MKTLLCTVFTFHFLFSLLTAILPLLVYGITGNPATSGYVLATFMFALLGSRVYLLKYDVEEVRLLKVGLLFYSSGFGLLLIESTTLFVFFIGALLFGIAVGIIAPALITLVTSSGNQTQKMVGIYNSLMGIASAIGPFAGLSLFYKVDTVDLYLILFLTSLTIFIPSLLIEMEQEREKTNANPFRKEIFSLEYMVYYISFLLISISYGAIIAFSPILFEHVHVRVDIFYFFFWSFFILSQIYMETIRKYVTEGILLPRHHFNSG